MILAIIFWGMTDLGQTVSALGAWIWKADQRTPKPAEPSLGSLTSLGVSAHTSCEALRSCRSPSPWEGLPFFELECCWRSDPILCPSFMGSLGGGLQGTRRLGRCSERALALAVLGARSCSPGVPCYDTSSVGGTLEGKAPGFSSDKHRTAEIEGVEPPPSALVASLVYLCVLD